MTTLTQRQAKLGEGLGEGRWAKQYKELRKRRSVGVLLPAIEEYMLRKHADGDDSGRDTKHLHPSEMSKADWCPRSSWFRMKGYAPEPTAEKSFSFFMENIWENGHDIHTKWQHRLWEMGVLTGAFGCYHCEYGWYAVAPKVCPECDSALLYYNEVPLFDDELLIIGHADGEVTGNDDYPIGRGLIELKSIAPGTLRIEDPKLYKQYQDGLRIDKLWGEIKRPFPSHVRQGMLYLRLRGLRRMTFIYEWKPTQLVKEFTLTYDDSIVAPLVEKAKELVTYMDSSDPPPRPGWAMAKEHSWCKKCPYAARCWSGEGHDPSSAKQQADTGVGENRGRRIRRHRPVGT